MTAPPPPTMKKSSRLFRAMSGRRSAWPFLLVLPIAWIVLISVGWTRDDYVEDRVENIWTQTDGDFYHDRKYADQYDRDSLGASTFAAMAISRDGDNLFTESRLQEIRTRMEQAEATTVEYKGETFSWNDVCYSNNAAGQVGTVYEFPCLRISPMDLFKEARWFFTEEHRVSWYKNIIQKLLVKPRLPRFGILRNVCSSAGFPNNQSTACDETLALRTNATYAVEQGLSPEYANPLELFSDIGDLEFNDPCRICIETGLEETMTVLTKAVSGMFLVMAGELNRFLQSGQVTDLADQQRLGALLQTVVKISSQIDRAAVEEFWFYYVARGLYVQLGVESYVENYAIFMANFGAACDGIFEAMGSTCPYPRTVDAATAAVALEQHADNVFSSVSTAGIPFPFWSNGDGTGALFFGDSPVGGSGLDLTGQYLSAIAYFDLEHYDPTAQGTTWNPLYSGQYADPITPGSNWLAFVESDPVYKWFMAGETEMTSSCGNGNLTGTVTGQPVDGLTGDGVATYFTQRWCTPYDTPFEEDGNKTVLHFTKMWYDLLIDSPQFLGIVQGKSDPYSWTTGQGCGYTLKGQRDEFTDVSEADILNNASRELYYIDEGVSIGAIDRNILIGDAVPDVQDYNFENPLLHVGVVQNIYAALRPEDIVERVKNCNRPAGPLNITMEDAEEILKEFKEAFEDQWAEGWDNETAGEVQFVGFFDDTGVIGTAGRMLRDVTLDNGKLMAISIIIIAVLSAIFLYNTDPIESRVLITTVGVALVILAFFAATGFGILVGIKINISIAWTLPFIILGLGVDDMYIVVLALKKQNGYARENFVAAMSEVVVPVTMTSLVNTSMFAVMNIVDVPAVYLTAQMALFSVIFLWLTIILCFPAYCYLDMRRQAAGRCDVLFCIKAKNAPAEEATDMEDVKGAQPEQPQQHSSGKDISGFFYDKIYKPLLFGKGTVRRLTHAIIWLGTFALIGVGIWGITQREIGLGLEDFFPEDNQANRWATVRTEELASWSIGINWGALNYTNPDVQMRMIQQFEDVISTPHVAERDTKALWMADLLIWTTTHCNENFDREDPNVKECGRDQVFPIDNSTCTGKWTENIYGLREKTFAAPETCEPFEAGICRPTTQMHPADLVALGIDPTTVSADDTRSWCPVFEGWTNDKLKFCVEQWRIMTGGGGNLVLVSDLEDQDPSETDIEEQETEKACPDELFLGDDEIVVPIPYSRGPTMYAYDLFTHEDTLNLIEDTRQYCDDDEEVHCFLSGIPYNYWEQYLWVEDVLLQTAGISVAVGFGVAALFLLIQLKTDGNHPNGKIVMGSLVGAFLIALTTLLCLVPVVGLSVLANVSFTAFSDMSWVLSVGFAVEYSVHVVHRFLEAPMSIDNAPARVEYAMSFLTLPLTLSFISSTIGVVCLAFTQFEFNKVYFFRPLIIVMFVCYYVGCWFLPVMLTWLDCDFLKLGAYDVSEGDNAQAEDVAAAVAVGKGDVEMPREEQSEEEEVLEEIMLDDAGSGDIGESVEVKPPEEAPVVTA